MELVQDNRLISITATMELGTTANIITDNTDNDYNLTTSTTTNDNNLISYAGTGIYNMMSTMDNPDTQTFLPGDLDASDSGFTYSSGARLTRNTAQTPCSIRRLVPRLLRD